VYPFRHAVGLDQIVGTNLMQIVGQAAANGDAGAQALLSAASSAQPMSGQTTSPSAQALYPQSAPMSPPGSSSNGGGGPYETPMVGNGPREFPMGFGITPVAMGANVIINAQPQVNFRPSRLVIPDSIAPSFMINDFKIGMRSQLVAPGSIPAQSFTQTAVGTAMALDTVNVGQFTTLDVTNVASQTVNFAASLFGTTLNS
jgi:hypothetical protein